MQPWYISHLENFGATNITTGLGLNQEILNVNAWLLSNKLVLNVVKSKYMLFFKHFKIVPTPILSINANPVEQVINFNFYLLPLTKTLPGVIIRGWLIITTITDARSFLHGMEAITKH